MRREGASYDDDTGALLVTLGSGGTIPNPVVTGTGGSGVPFVIAQSYAAVSGAADTNENTLATVTIPANAMGANGLLMVDALWTVTNGADDKILRIRFSGASGTQYFGATITSSATVRVNVLIANRGATNSQVGWSGPTTVSYGGSAQAAVTSAVDTTAATTLVFTGQKETAGNTLTLDGYTVYLIKP